MTDHMSRYNAHNMRGPSLTPGWCAVCGRPHPEAHHIVPRSLGGADGPVIHLCGRGNALFDALGNELHHGLVENHRLWLWFNDGEDADIAPALPQHSRGCWCYLLSARPINEMDALARLGWRAIWGC